ncbi:MAG: D-aminoacyl-tRNA deacylase [Chlamydiales bacterium]
MKLVIQRVLEAKVEVDNTIVGQIGQGLCVLIGMNQDDQAPSIDWLAEKLVNLRVFPDREGKMNLNVQEIHGEVLVVSQFTLYADCSKGRRPGFSFALDGPQAETLYDQFVSKVKTLLGKVQTGRFGAKMAVSLVNDGPATFILERNN